MALNMHGNENPRQSKNPYEDAEPIAVPLNSTKRERTRSRTHVRSRSVQYAQDAALRQERIARVDDGNPGVRPSYESASRPRTSRSPQARQTLPSQRTPRPQETPQGTHTHPQGYYSSSQLRRRPPQQAPKPYNMRTRRKANFGIIASIIIVAIVILSFLLWWINRPVAVTVNGEETEVRVGSSLTDVLHEERVDVKPGDYVSVSGRVITALQGNAFSARVNGKDLTPEQMDEYRVVGAEAIEFGDGEDVVEEFEAESEVIMPYLRMEGSGYSLQYISQWAEPGEFQHRIGKETGEVADVIAKEPKDCIITCRDLFIEGDTKYVALTFDDGPADPYTEQYLEILDRYDVKATFFNLGKNTQSYPEIAQRVVAAGHQLCNHTMDHNQLTAVDANTIYNEITRSASAIEDATGVSTTFIRPPYGDFTERSWLGSGGAITASIRWNGDSRDWALPGVDGIVENSLINLHSGSIILMHDGGGDRSQDVEALPRLIEKLQAEGYKFVTISDLMRAAGDIPEDICSGTSTMPEDAIWPDEIHPDDIAAAAAAASSTSS